MRKNEFPAECGRRSRVHSYIWRREKTNRFSGQTFCGLNLVSYCYLPTVLVLRFQYCPGTIFLLYSQSLFDKDYERAVIFQLGRVREDSMEKRGLFPLNHIVSKIEKVKIRLIISFKFDKVDIRTKVFDIPQQEIISKDAVTIRVDAVVHYKVVDPLKAVNVVQNFNNTTVS